MKIRFSAGLIAGIVLLASSAHAQFARQEVIALQSVTISDNDFLQGKKDGKAVTIAGRLLLPKATPDAKQPAVILIHGSGGLGSSAGSTAEWERELASAGFAVFSLDSFTGRGIVSTVADQSQLGRYNAIIDAYRALEVLAKHLRPQFVYSSSWRFWHQTPLRRLVYLMPGIAGDADNG